jgi:TRAP-type C4-dicarboxylate transport system substrate-binding protein
MNSFRVRLAENGKRVFQVILACALTLPAVPAFAGNVVQLSMTSNVMDRHASIAEFYKPAFERIRERTNGTLVITYYNPGTICPEGDIFDSVAAGQVDIGSHYTNRNAGKLPVTSVFFQPMVFTNSHAAARTAWEFYSASPEARTEYERTGVKVLGFCSGVPTDLQFTGDPALTLEQLRGLKIITTDSYSMRIVRLLGANPIQIPTVDAYLSLQRNMAEGANLPIPVLRSAKIAEATKSCLRVGLRNPVQWVGINQERFQSLSPEHQAALLEFLSGEALADGSSAIVDNTAQSDYLWLQERGYKFYDIDPAERLRWRELLVEDCKATWLKEVSERGIHNGDEIFRRFMEIAARNEAAYGLHAKP